MGREGAHEPMARKNGDASTAASIQTMLDVVATAVTERTRVRLPPVGSSSTGAHPSHAFVIRNGHRNSAFVSPSSAIMMGSTTSD